MKIHIIAVHYDTQSKNKITGFRLLDSDSGQVMDQPYNAVKNVIASGTANIIGAKIDNSTGELKGTNGSLDRYTALCNNKPLNNSIVIINSIDDKGFKASNYIGKTVEIPAYELINAVRKPKYKLGIANGKLVEKDGKFFISAISGNYDNIPFAKSELSKDKQVINRINDKKDDKKYSEELNKKLKPVYRRDPHKFPKVITGTKNPNSRLHELDPETGMTAEQKMAYTMVALKAVKPFYYSIYNCLNRVEANPDDHIDTMAVSLNTLYFDVDFVLECTLPELLFVVIHEVCHIAMKHRVRENGREHETWNMACDYFINRQIAVDFGLTQSERVKYAQSKQTSSSAQYKIALPEQGLYNAEVNVDTDTPEKLYEELMKLQQDNKDNGKGNQGGNQESSDSQDNGSGSSSENNSNSNSESSSDEDKDDATSQELKDFADGKESSNNKDKGNKEGNESEDNSGNGQEQPDNNTEESEDSKQGKGKAGKDGDDNNSNDSSGQGNKNQKGESKGRCIGKEFRGQEIPDYNSDIVDDATTRALSNEQMAQQAQSLLNRAVTIHRQSHTFGGDNADWLERYVEKALAPQVNWVALLKNKLTLATQTVNTFARPDKRFRSRGMIMPGPKKLDNDALENVKICIDTSGSISPRDLGVALTQIDQLFKKFHADAEVLYWDTRIRAIYPFEDPKELVNKKPMGGGGTDANCIFEYFEENKDYRIGKKKKPSIIIVFTDGCFGDVHKRYSKYKDTIWVINGNYDFTAPFGSKAMFKRDE